MKREIKNDKSRTYGRKRGGRRRSCASCWLEQEPCQGMPMDYAVSYLGYEASYYCETKNEYADYYWELEAEYSDGNRDYSRYGGMV